MNYFYFVGIDMANNTFDVTILSAEETYIDYKHFSNNKTGIAQMLSWVKKRQIKLSQTLFCVENMGTYISLLATESVKRKFNLALACPLSIKRSLGITRGKNDKIDSERIALYAIKFKNKLIPYIPVPDAVNELSGWLTIRENLIKKKVSTQLLIHSFESNKLLKTNDCSDLLKLELAEIKVHIKNVEIKIAEVVNSDQSVKHNYDLLNSVKGVGIVVASVLIVSTGNFTKFDNAKRYASYCGIAPFEHSSGTSIRGRTRVSKMSSKELRVSITQASLSASVHDKQTKRYYDRKLAEGKDKSCVLNAVKNKIVARCFAVIRRGTPYVSLDI